MDQDKILIALKKESKTNFFNKDEELNVFREYQNGNKDLGEAIIKNYIRFVIKFARKYSRNGNLLDLIQEGNLGVLDAASRFNIESGNRFISYAAWYIKSYIFDAIKGYSQETISLDSKLYDDSDLTGIESLSDEKNISSIEFLENKFAIETIRKHMDSLNPEYSRPMKLLYFDCKSLNEISEITGMTKTMITGRISVGRKILASNIKKDQSLYGILENYNI
jgi:RNA polymerase sigma factor (sigma-70 family)